MAALRVFFRSRADVSFEVFALRQQVAVLKRKRPRPTVNRLDRLFWVVLRRLWSRWKDALVIVKPDTVVGWHRAGFRLYWRWRSRPSGGRPRVNNEIRCLIRRMAGENSGWGAPKIHGELLKLGFEVSERTVARRSCGKTLLPEGVASTWPPSSTRHQRGREPVVSQSNLGIEEDRRTRPPLSMPSCSLFK